MIWSVEKLPSSSDINELIKAYLYLFQVLLLWICCKTCWKILLPFGRIWLRLFLWEPPVCSSNEGSVGILLLKESTQILDFGLKWTREQEECRKVKSNGHSDCTLFFCFSAVFSGCCYHFWFSETSILKQKQTKKLDMNFF